MTYPDKLTIEEAEKIAVGVYDSYAKTSITQMAKQLAETIRELEKIKGAALALIAHVIPGKEKTSNIQNRHIKRLADALQQDNYEKI